ncbi:PKD domain-containing protein [Moheibacter stercoris]|uniref:Cbb3-type cytochrome oxidase subunit 3 n=1 Tax=Moheibacter stercoris TaxID=1628251 RepID=A0ABV2LSF9_9FLAO
MKKKKTPYNSLFSNFDYRILLLFLTLIIIGLIVFWFRSKNAMDCGEAKMLIKSENFAAGEVVEFFNDTENATEWEWDFGDGSPKDYRKSTLHKYESPGVYRVRLTINKNCHKEQLIEITDQGRIIDRTKLPYIVGPDRIEVGEPVTFRYNYYTDQTMSWQWSFGESGQIDATDEYPTYIFQYPGKKVVTLIINGEIDYKAYKTLYVVPKKAYDGEKDTLQAYVYQRSVESFDKPEGNPPKSRIPAAVQNIPLTRQSNDGTMAPDISTERFKLALEHVIKQTKDKKELEEYFCQNKDIPVMKNGKDIIPYSEFLNDVTGKDVKIESIRLHKNNFNCIESFTIHYKVKKFMIWTED